MGVKFYVKDDVGNEYGPIRWTTRSDCKHFAGLVRSKELLKVIETHFGLDLDQLLLA